MECGRCVGDDTAAWGLNSKRGQPRDRPWQPRGRPIITKCRHCSAGCQHDIYDTFDMLSTLMSCRLSRILMVDLCVNFKKISHLFSSIIYVYIKLVVFFGGLGVRELPRRPEHPVQKWGSHLADPLGQVAAPLLSGRCRLLWRVTSTVILMLHACPKLCRDSCGLRIWGRLWTKVTHGY